MSREKTLDNLAFSSFRTFERFVSPDTSGFEITKVDSMPFSLHIFRQFIFSWFVKDLS